MFPDYNFNAREDQRKVWDYPLWRILNQEIQVNRKVFSVFIYTKPRSFTSQVFREQKTLQIVISAMNELSRSGEASFRKVSLNSRPE